MNELTLANKAAEWSRLKSLVLDSVSSPITKRVYNLGLDEFFEWYGLEPRPGFTKATVAAWRVALEARGLGAVSINVRITAVRKLAVEAADNGLLAPELANGITRVKGVASKGVRLGNWLSLKQAQALLNAPDITTTKGFRDRAIIAVLLGCGLVLAICEAASLFIFYRSVEGAALEVATQLRLAIHRQAFKLGASDLLGARTSRPEELFGEKVEQVREGVASWWRIFPRSVRSNSRCWPASDWCCGAASRCRRCGSRC